MKRLINPLNLTTTSLVLGLIAFNISSAQAMSWTRTVTSFPDNYSDTRNPTTNFGTSNFLSIGRAPTNTITSAQTPYVSFNLQSIIDDVNKISPTAFITNVTARLVFQQTNTNPANPNNLNGAARNLPNTPRITSLQGFQVTGNFNESQAINPSTPPATGSTVLFSVPASTGVTQGQNIFTGAMSNGVNQLDALLQNLLENKNPNFAVNLRATGSRFNSTQRIFPVDDFFSQNSGTNNPNCPLASRDCRPRLELNFDVFDQGFNVPGGPNFKVQGRAGGTGTYEATFLSVNALDQDVVIAPQTNWSWGGGRSGVQTNFRLTCNNNTASLFLSNTTTFGTTPQLNYTATNNCQNIEGLRIFSAAQLRNNSVITGDSVGIIVNCASQINDANCIPVRDLSATAIAGNQLIQDAFFLTNSNSRGGLGFTQGADVVEGRIIFTWQRSNNPLTPNPLAGGQSNLQVQLIPLTRINDPRPSSPSPSVPLIPFSNSFGSTQPLNNDPQSVPEPTAVISLLLLGSLGTTIKLRGKK